MFGMQKLIIFIHTTLGDKIAEFLHIIFDSTMPRRRKSSGLSIRRNKSKFQSQFKKGHLQFSVNQGLVEDSEPGPTVSVEQGVHVLTRLQQVELSDVLAAAEKSPKQPGVIPYTLRPATVADNENRSKCKVGDDINCNENIIVNVQQLQCLLQASMLHSCASPCADLDIVDRQGICVSGILTCRNCAFSTDKVELYTKVKTSNGPDAGSLNSALLLPVMKSRVGISDQLLSLSCLNIKVPDSRGLQRKMNALSDNMEQINEQQMILNQQYIKKVHTLAGVEAFGDVEFDVS
jgi:hypothetical protein